MRPGRTEGTVIGATLPQVGRTAAVGAILLPAGRTAVGVSGAILLLAGKIAAVGAILLLAGRTAAVGVIPAVANKVCER